MSKRHQDLQFVRQPREVRQRDKRRVRHEIAQTLHTIDDPETAVVAQPKADRVPLQAMAPKPGRLRHWKVKAWKRRTNQRHQRNEALAQLLRTDDD